MSPQCPYCSGASKHLVASLDFNRGTTDLEFNYFKCLACGLVFMDPIPDDLGPFYQGGYQQIPNDLAGLREIAAKERYRLDPILRYKTSGKLLEIGPWMGIFSCNAKDTGFDVTAIEIDANCVDFLRNTVGISAIQSADPAHTMSTMTEQFDVIALWHCLEHLQEPWRVVQEAARRLAPGGIVIVAIPNIESHEFSVLKERWRHLDTPRHLYFYPINSLAALARENGLKMLEVETNDELSKALAGDTWGNWAQRKFNQGVFQTFMARLSLRLSQYNAKRKSAGAGITAVFGLSS